MQFTPRSGRCAAAVRACVGRRARRRRLRRATTTAAAAARQRRRRASKTDADRRRQGRRVLHHDELRRPGRGQEARRRRSTSRGPTSSTPTLQTPIVNAVAAKKPDAMLIAPTDTKAMYAPIKQVADAGIEDRARRHHARATPTWPSRRSPPTTTAAARPPPRRSPKLIGGKGKVFVVNVKPGHLDHRPARQGLRGRGQEARARLRRAGVQPGPARQGGGDRQGAAGQEPGPRRASSRRTCSRPRARRAGLRESGKHGRVKIVGFDAGPKQVQDLKDGPRSRRSSPRSPPTSAPRACSRRSPRSRASATKKKIGTGSTILTKDNLSREPGRDLQVRAAEPVVRSAGPLPRGPAASRCSDNDERQES